jgi:hypothetical protein
MSEVLSSDIKVKLVNDKVVHKNSYERDLYDSKQAPSNIANDLLYRQHS